MLRVELKEDVKGIGKSGRLGTIYESNLSTNDNVCVLFDGNKHFRYVNSRFLKTSKFIEETGYEL